MNNFNYDDPLYKANCTADTLYALWRGTLRMYELYKASADDVRRTYNDYILAEAQRQIVRRDRGLTYILTPHMREVLEVLDDSNQ